MEGKRYEKTKMRFKNKMMLKHRESKLHRNLNLEGFLLSHRDLVAHDYNLHFLATLFGFIMNHTYNIKTL